MKAGKVKDGSGISSILGNGWRGGKFRDGVTAYVSNSAAMYIVITNI